MIKLKKYFILKWQPLTDCNYHCSYCCQKNKNKNNLNNIYLNAKLIKEKIINKINRKIFLSISGGELSIIKINNLLKIFNILIDKKIKIIYITSNFSNTAEYYNSIYNWCKLNKIKLFIEFSFHDEFTTEENFFNKIKKLKFKPINIQTVVTENNYLFMNELKKKHKNVFFEPNIYNNIDKINFKFTNKEKQRYLANKKNLNYNKKCLQNQISIKENGDVYNNNCKMLKYGNLSKNVIIPKNDLYLKCTKKECHYSHIQEII